MAPKVNDQWQLPASLLSKLLKERRMLKADLSKQECVGDYTLNKRTVANIDKGEPVTAHTLEKLAKALKFSSVDELMREAQEKISLEIDFSRPTVRQISREFGDPQWHDASEIKVSDLLYLVRWKHEIKWDLRLDAVSDQQTELLQRLEAIVEKRVKDGADSMDDTPFDSDTGGLTKQLNALRTQDSYANLLSELESHGIGIYFYKHTRRGTYLNTKVVSEPLFHPENEWIEQEKFEKVWRSYTTIYIVVSELNLDVRLHLDGDIVEPTPDEIRSNPMKYFSMTTGQMIYFDLPPTAGARFHELSLSGHTAYFVDDQLKIVEDDIPF